ncbi:MAG: hypothetical protein KF682_14770 [Nitrospira sp.]|nr:hypothetical protein [Nitrospira sp.]
MKQGILIWILISIASSVMGMILSSVDARELDQETYQLLSYGMTEAEVVGRAGQPDRRIDQLEPTPLSQRIVSYQYIWGGDTNRGEWTTTITFSSNTNRVIRIDRERR